MALSTCNSCGGFLTGQSGACPNCGHAAPKSVFKRAMRKWAAAAAAGGAAITLGACYGVAAVCDLPDGGTTTACGFCDAVPDAGGNSRYVPLAPDGGLSFAACGNNYYPSWVCSMGCTTDADCGNGASCDATSGQCANACASNSDCAYPELACNTDAGVCTCPPPTSASASSSGGSVGSVGSSTGKSSIGGSIGSTGTVSVAGSTGSSGSSAGSTVTTTGTSAGASSGATTGSGGSTGTAGSTGH